MPGIVGLITQMPRVKAEKELLRMVETLRHESFYISGVWVAESLGVYVGWVARKTFSCEGTPILNERGDTVLIFFGEEFRDTAAVAGKHDRGSWGDERRGSDLVRTYEEDEAFPAKLNGRFQGLVVDRAKGSVVLFNDRYGMHRLYYHQGKDGFYFAAEAKAILSVRPELRRLEPRALGEFVVCGCVLENRTLFEGIRVLPPASKWILRDGEIKEQGTYFSPREWEEQEVLQPDDYYLQVREIFSQKLPLYFQAREQVGMSLTGGLDSRVILAWQRLLPGSLPCYTFSGMFRDCRDVTVAKHVAQACAQPHKVLTIGSTFLKQFSRYAERTVYMADGCVDVRRASDLYLSEQVRDIAPIRMTGNYGGEVLRGVRAFKPIRPLPGLFKQELVPYFREAEETYQSLLEGHPVSFAVFKQAPWHHYGLLALEETQVSVRTPFLDNDLVATVFRAPLQSLASPDLCWRLIEDGSAMLCRIPTEHGSGATWPAAGIVERIQRFLTKAEYAYDYGMPQWLAKVDHALSPLQLERLFLGRQKFTHYRVWYRDSLSGYVQQMLLDSRTLSRPYLEPKRVEAIVEGHLNGSQNYTNEIHTLLTLELLHRLLLDLN